jgi:bacterioferritin (cytochrome b1)
MNSGKDVVNMIKAHVKFEKKTASKIKELEGSTANLAAKLFLAEMRFDTEKHAKILQTLLDVMKQKEDEAASGTLWNTKIRSYVDAIVAKRMLEDHIKVEENMLKHVEEEIGETEDDALKLLLEHIADDEKKHHKIMEIILKRAFKIGP